ncbi:class I SAM-dependent methyltransferase [Sphingomonas sp. R86520]|uniref:class I SAM-dependent methyltransferase n=1 Tax=Sphingomonas sp. R86520 TaxID=3093859 RepID=UPI0036D3C9B6
MQGRGCRHCGGSIDLVLADLGEMPVANDYVDPIGAPEADAIVGLKVVVCADCRLAQTIDHKDASDLFRDDYAYFSSTSQEWLAHASDYVDQMVDRFSLKPGTRHVELASNDGYLLQYSIAHGLSAVGVEPCNSVADVAIAKGIDTQVAFFGREYALDMIKRGGQADLITANNVFAHVPDVNDFATGIYELLKPDAVATIEVQHLLRLMERLQFDTIYHEHFSYYSLFAAMRVFASAGLRVFDVEELTTHGGSLRYFVCRADAAHVTSPAVQALLDEELAYGIDRDETYADWAIRVRALRDEFRGMLKGLKSKGKSIAAYGAPAKGTTLLNYCGIGRDIIDFTVDRAVSKQGRMIPGVRIPIRSPSALDKAQPDYVVILPWNLREEIVSDTSLWAAHPHTQFISAIPWPAIFAA